MDYTACAGARAGAGAHAEQQAHVHICNKYITINDSVFPAYARDEIRFTLDALSGKNKIFNEINNKYPLVLKEGVFIHRGVDYTIILSCYGREYIQLS